MKIQVLGSGTSLGVPEIGCTCPVCTSTNPKDKRMRCSSLVTDGDVRILLDCGPDFYQQAFNIEYKPLSAVLITHIHYDHVSGLDDLRAFSRLAPVDVYADSKTTKALYERMPYCFGKDRYPGSPKIHLHTLALNEMLMVGHIKVIPFKVMHGQMSIFGYRIGKLAYITDMLTMPEESYETVEGIEILFINALRLKSHKTHQTVEHAIAAAQRIGARETYIIHMNHDFGLHDEMEKFLPANIHVAYDGMIVEF
ncbi:MAG: MBL fold metallo-hydrolase [Bacteroidaceae bacterium]